MAKPNRQKFINKIVIHHSAAIDTPALNLDGIRDYHKSKGWIDIGYHYLVERVNGKLQFLAGRPLNRVGAHAGGANTNSIGICLMGNFSLKSPDEELLDFAAYHVAGLFVMIDTPGIWPHREVEIWPHREVGTTKTECPGLKFPWESFIAKVNKYT